jgi:hypothetical protein
MADLPDRLRALAETLNGDEWEHPITAPDDCLAAADELERLRSNRPEIVLWLTLRQAERLRGLLETSIAHAMVEESHRRACRQILRRVDAAIAKTEQPTE